MTKNKTQFEIFSWFKTVAAKISYTMQTNFYLTFLEAEFQIVSIYFETCNFYPSEN